MPEIQPNPAPSAKNRTNALLLALVVLLLISNVILLILWFQKKDQVVASEDRVTALSSEKENVTKLLEDMLVQYDTLSTTNDQMRTRMDSLQKEIVGLMDKVKRGNYDVSKARKEAETLRKIMKGYVATIDSLNQVNQALMAENISTKQQLGEMTGQKQALEAKSAEQQALISKGSALTATGMKANAIFQRNNGKQVDTDRSSKAEMIKCCFNLGENRIAEAGKKTLYMRIIGPDGSVLPAEEQANRFFYDGVEGEFSVKRDVDYQNAPVDVCIYWTATGKLTGGEYKVDAYEGGLQVGHTTFNLK
ncbi:MAG: COG2 family protein [Flavobacteriales bacterium]|nr:COG2 family protein [Flavobacteriales bacterium]